MTIGKANTNASSAIFWVAFGELALRAGK